MQAFISRYITSVGEERAVFLLSFDRVILLFLVEGVSSSSGCMGKAALIYCGTPCALDITLSVS